MIIVLLLMSFVKYVHDLLIFIYDFTIFNNKDSIMEYFKHIVKH